MFTNATLFTLYAQARRDEDLLPRRAKPRRGLPQGRGAWLAQIFRRSVPVAQPAAQSAPQRFHPARG